MAKRGLFKGFKRKVFKEFREFAVRGNVLDLAVGIIIGGAFGKIVTSLVNDIIMPPIGMIMGRLDFTNLYISLDGRRYGSLAEAKEAGAATLNYGVFINTIIDFLIVSLAVFFLVRQFNRLKRLLEEDRKPAPPAVKSCPYCLSSIPIAATRCPQCTSHLGGDAKGA